MLPTRSKKSPSVAAQTLTRYYLMDGLVLRGDWCLNTFERLKSYFLCGCLANSLLPYPALAQSVTPGAPLVPTGPLPTDVTQIRLPEERELLRPGPSLYLFQKLPANLWFNTSTETNLRFESNVFLAAHQPKRDIVYRAFPNVTVGYNFLKNTGVYCNYFVIKDVYGDTAPGIVGLTLPTTQSVSLGFRHSKQIKRTNLQFDFQSRELWQNKRLHQFDYIPGILVSRSLSPTTFGFINLQIQMRGRTAFVSPTREIDPFYTVGVLHSFGLWTLSVTDTFITNFRSPPFRNSVPHHSNVGMIADIELYHPILKRYPNVVGFIRAEPIWNWLSDRTTGLSGFDFRLYSGVRFAFAKPAFGSTATQTRKELQTEPKREDSKPAPSPSDTVRPVPNSRLPSNGPREAFVPIVSPINTSESESIKDYNHSNYEDSSQLGSSFSNYLTAFKEHLIVSSQLFKRSVLRSELLSVDPWTCKKELELREVVR